MIISGGLSEQYLGSTSVSVSDKTSYKNSGITMRRDCKGSIVSVKKKPTQKPNAQMFIQRQEWAYIDNFWKTLDEESQKSFIAYYFQQRKLGNTCQVPKRIESCDTVPRHCKNLSYQAFFFKQMMNDLLCPFLKNWVHMEVLITLLSKIEDDYIFKVRVVLPIDIESEDFVREALFIRRTV